MSAGAAAGDPRLVPAVGGLEPVVRPSRLVSRRAEKAVPLLETRATRTRNEPPAAEVSNVASSSAKARVAAQSLIVGNFVLAGRTIDSS